MFSDGSIGLEILGWMTMAFIFVIGVFLLFLLGVYISDVTQTRQAISTTKDKSRARGSRFSTALLVLLAHAQAVG